MEHLGNAAEMLSCNVNQIYVPVVSVIHLKHVSKKAKPTVTDQTNTRGVKEGACGLFTVH